MEETVSNMEPMDAESAKQDLESFPELGRRIVQLRRSRRWSRSELAEKLGVSSSRISKWERGVNVPPLRCLLEMRSVLGLSLDELVTGEPAPDLGWSVGEWTEFAHALVGLIRLLRRLGILEEDEEDWD